MIAFGCRDQLGVDVDTDHVMAERGKPAADPSRSTSGAVTRACGLACAHCRANAIPHRDPRELSTVEARRLIDDLVAYNTPRPILVLTGGDPFERDDLAELVGYATQRGLHVSLSPSVTPRLTAARLAGLRSAGASAVSLSLDGARPETHDGLRGIDGTHRDTLLAATMVREAGFRLQINTTVHAGNVNELPDLFAWLAPAFTFLAGIGTAGITVMWLAGLAIIAALYLIGRIVFSRLPILFDGHGEGNASRRRRFCGRPAFSTKPRTCFAARP